MPSTISLRSTSHNHNAPYTYGEFSNFADNMLDEDEDRITENGSVKTAARERLVGAVRV